LPEEEEEEVEKRSGKERRNEELTNRNRISSLSSTHRHNPFFPCETLSSYKRRNLDLFKKDFQKVRSVPLSFFQVPSP
jgi:hypothetical protein